MANQSIYNAFERMWQHVIAELGNKANKTEIDAAIAELEEQVDYVGLQIDGKSATKEEVLEMLTDLGVVTPIVDSNNKIYISNNDKIYSL